MHKPIAAAIAAALIGLPLIAGCATGQVKQAPTDDATAARSSFIDDPYPSTYQPIASPPVLITGATVLTGTGTRLDNAGVLMRDGRIVAVGANLDAPADAVRVDGSGKWVTPRCECTSMTPGVTHLPLPSTRIASAGASRLAPTATMRPSRISTPALSRRVPVPVSTVAPVISTGGEAIGWYVLG